MMSVGEWDHRQLCADGACVGVIGPSGTCKVCGRAAPNWGEERTRGLVADAVGVPDDDEDEGEGDDQGEDEDDHDEDDEDDEVDEIDPSAPAALGEAKVWQDRRLCPDGSCIGLIGDSGACKVCGKRRSPAGTVRTAGDHDALASAAAELAAVVPAADLAELAPPPAPDDDEDEDEDEDADEDAAGSEASDEAESLEARKLCPDGACVGVIGVDGRCKVCGAEAT